MRIFFDMDGVRAKWTPVEYEERLYEKGFYRNLEADEKIRKLIDELIKKGIQTYGLSKYLSDSRYALKEKIEWSHENNPSMDDEHLIWVRYEDNKSDYIPNGIQRDDFLIDDYSPNLFEFEKSGGQAIKFMNGINGTKGTWKGKSVSADSNDLLKDLIGCIKDSLIRTETFRLGKNQYVGYDASYIENSSRYSGCFKLKAGRSEDDIRKMLSDPEINIRKIDTTNMSYVFDAVLTQMTHEQFDDKYHISEEKIGSIISMTHKRFSVIEEETLRQCFSRDISLFLEKTNYIKTEKDGKGLYIDPDILTIFENSQRNTNRETGKKMEIDYYLTSDESYKDAFISRYFPKEVRIQAEKEREERE